MCEPGFLCISLLRITCGPRVKFVDRKRSLNSPVGYATDRSKTVVPVVFVFDLGLWFILRGVSFLVLPCSLSSCFSVFLAL